MKIRIAEISDLQDLIDHDLRHFKEPGFNNLYAHPFSRNHPFKKEEMLANKLESWNTEVGAPRWSRSFLLLDDNNQITGHLNLKNQFIGTLHRAELGMGIEAHMRGVGAGKKLMAEALTWARSLDFLEWIDLTVFAHNLPAKKLYQSFGFTEMCTVKDQIRVDGYSIDDIKMTLKLK